MEGPVRQLHDIVGWGVAHDVFAAEEATTLLLFIGENAEPIKAATFGAFFGALQRTLGESLILSMARMFETEKRYPLRSIPAALEWLKVHSADVPINNRYAVLDVLKKKLGRDDGEHSRFTDRDLTLSIVSAFSGELQRLQAVAGEAIKMIRDKVVAHRELVEVHTLPKPTYAQIGELVGYAKDFATTVGSAYTTVVTSDPEQTTRCLERILAAAGVVTTRRNG